MPSTNTCQSPGPGAEVRSLSSVDRVPATYFIGATAQDVRLEAQLVSLGSRATEGRLLTAGWWRRGPGSQGTHEVTYTTRPDAIGSSERLLHLGQRRHAEHANPARRCSAEAHSRRSAAQEGARRRGAPVGPTPRLNPLERQLSLDKMPRSASESTGSSPGTSTNASGSPLTLESWSAAAVPLEQRGA